MRQNNDKKNVKSYLLLAVVVIAVIGIFTYFIYIFTKYDKTEYEVIAGSVVYDSNQEYMKIQGEAYITQKFDRNYYLYEEVDGETRKYKLGKNAVLYREGDMYLYIYGPAYQVLTTGDVDAIAGETKVTKTSPTKFFKLDDRKYVMVDTNIRTDNTDILDTSDYVIIYLDKKGNPSFSNHLVNFKTISQIVVSASAFSFDIAHEKLVYEDTEIDLKNVIGSTNEYVDPEEIEQDLTDEKLDAIQNNIKENSDTMVGYYDAYFKDVIKSVNNLTQSVIGANNNAILGLNKNDVYYDFVKWLVLKSVTPKVATIEVGYSVFDPSDDYQVVHLVVTDPYNNSVKHTLNKNDITYVIRDLQPNTSYTIALTYFKVGGTEEVVEDTIIVTTRRAEYELQVKKISSENVPDPYEPTKEVEQYTLHYEMTFDTTYKFTQANIQYQGFRRDAEGKFGDSPSQQSEVVTIMGTQMDNSGVYTGTIVLEPGLALAQKNVITVNNVKFCEGYEEANLNKCPVSDITFSYKFFQE